MFRIIAIIMVLIISTPELPTSPLGGTSSAEMTPKTEPTPNLTEEERELVSWARGRFNEAGLRLPDVTVRFDPSRTLCNNNQGLYRFVRGIEHVVSICIRESESFAAQVQRRRTLIHEFAHVWDTVNQTGTDRAPLNALFGTAGWYAEDAAWADRGAEQFAEMFVLGLLDQPARQLKITTGCAALVRGFLSVTGVAPLGPGAPQCVA